MKQLMQHRNPCHLQTGIRNWSKEKEEIEKEGQVD
jgi:hypothetical protein